MTKNTFEALCREVAATGLIPMATMDNRVKTNDPFLKRRTRNLHTETWQDLQPSQKSAKLQAEKPSVLAKRPGTGRRGQMVRTLSVRKFRLGILDYLRRAPIFS